MADSFNDNQDGGPIPIGTRMEAWWKGYDPRELHSYKKTLARLSDQGMPPDEVAAEFGRQTRVETEPADDDDPVWPNSRIEVIQRLFGRGFIIPGGAEQMAHVCKPFGLTPQQTVMDVSAGLGGGPAALSEFFGVWVGGFERNPKLVEAAPAAIKGLRGISKVKIEGYSPTGFAPKPKSVDCVVCRESLYLVDDKADVLTGMKMALKDWGQLLITDYVLPDTAPPKGRLDDWIASQPERVTLWTKERYEQALTDRGFDVRIVEDLSEEQHGLIKASFSNLLETVAQSDLFSGKPLRKRALMKETEEWARRAAMLESGEIKLYRFFALKPM